MITTANDNRQRLVRRPIPLFDIKKIQKTNHFNSIISGKVTI